MARLEKLSPRYVLLVLSCYLLILPFQNAHASLLQSVDGIAKYESRLQINGTSFDDFGEYMCEVLNAKGQASKRVALSPKGRT